MLYTLEEARGKGYSQKTYAYLMLQILRERKILPYAHVDSDNVISNKLHTKFNFENRGDVSWVLARPKQ